MEAFVNVGLSDRDIVWCVHVYDSVRQLAWWAHNVRRNYPRSRVVVVNDGDVCDYSRIVDEWEFEYVSGAHLMCLGLAHEYVSRMLRVVSQGNEKIGFKIDPDAKVWRRLRVAPGQPCMFGTIETVTENLRAPIFGPPNIQGGCIGMSLEVAREILSLGILTKEACAKEYERTWARCRDMKLAAQKGRMCDDFVLTWAASCAGVPLVGCPEIGSAWRRTPANEDLRFAVTHPHKVDDKGADNAPSVPRK
jgi:hypothetical protein